MNTDEPIGLQKMFDCLECEDTGMVWTCDPEFPDLRQADLLVACECQRFGGSSE